METLNEVFQYVVELLQRGFREVNAVQGIVIAIIAAIVMKSWTKLVPIAFGATLAHALADMLIPVIAGQRAFQLPPIVDASYWTYVLTVFVGYLVVILVLFILKSALVKG
ncbi:MAG: hypothetical protein H6923_03945 [Alphaproteobacteria bacterium]|nr:hypothetical protein [Alphaproteobacteria bacterium]